ncbi:MAG: radical SAM protein [Thermoplasmatota archaeon]
MEQEEVGAHLSRNILDLMDRASSLLEETMNKSSGWVEDLVQDQAVSARRRAELDEMGVHVPAFMIISVTRRCNLDCRGCYAKKLHASGTREMDDGLLGSILSQARELGVSIILTAGGEPLLRPGLIPLLKGFPEVIFPVFTNGTLLDETTVKELSEGRNIVPILSMEGFEEDTDHRRGEGVFNRVSKASAQLSSVDIFWGISITVTSQNFDVVTGRDFVTDLILRGCRLFFYVEYIPVEEGTEHCAPTHEQRHRLVELMDQLGSENPGLFITFPGDEEALGGCLSSGRGFVHVNPSGDLEPCPFAPYSDTNLRDTPLREALGSRLLAEIRGNHHRLEETRGGCALWENREWVRGLLR